MLSALKLLFFADRYHLRKYARMVTGDTYYAMEKGPVPSFAKDLLSAKLEGEISDYADRFLKIDPKRNFEAAIDIEPDKLEFLSETDIEALDFALENFGSLSSHQLWSVTHKYPEWRRFADKFEDKKDDKKTRALILTDDFFEEATDADDPYASTPKEIVSISKEIYRGLA